MIAGTLSPEFRATKLEQLLSSLLWAWIRIFLSRAGRLGHDFPRAAVICSHAQRIIHRIHNMNQILLIAILSSIIAPLSIHAAKPNIIVIYTDDHGYADLGCVGVMADVKTPNIDALAKGGVLMAAGYVTAPQCSPSRCGLMSGQYQGKFGMDHNGMLESDHALRQTFWDLNNLPKRMKSAGYVTALGGKSHLGSNDSADLVKMGFDKVFFKHSDAPGHWNMDVTGKDLPPQKQKDGYYHLEMIADYGCAFLERFKDDPKFLYLAFRGPHVPLDAPKKYLTRFPGDMPVERRKALGAISCIDDGVGKLMATLRKIGQEENTLIFVISDNGAPIKQMPHQFVTDDKGLKTLKPGTTPVGWNGWDGSLNEPMNGEKGMLTEGGIRTPFVVHWKGTIPGGQVYKNPVISLDVAATANALAGLPDDPILDGVNLIPYLSGKNPGVPHETLYWRWTSQYAIRKGDWKYITFGAAQYLFHLATDPYEKSNLAEKDPAQAKELRAELAKWTETLNPAGLPEAKGSGGVAKSAFGYFVDGQPGPKNSPKGAKHEAEEEKEDALKAKEAQKEATPNKQDDTDWSQQLFARRDTNADGHVTLEEFIAGRTGPTMPALTKRFKAFDTDGDGNWTKAELETTNPKSPTE